jgi:hypothetical protein
MNDPDVWAAFESTPPPTEPVANKDNSLQGFQRRILEQCGQDLELATKLLDRAYAILAQISVGLEPYGYGDLMVDIDDFRDRNRG